MLMSKILFQAVKEDFQEQLVALVLCVKNLPLTKSGDEEGPRSLEERGKASRHLDESRVKLQVGAKKDWVQLQSTTQSTGFK